MEVIVDLLVTGGDLEDFLILHRGLESGLPSVVHFYVWAIDHFEPLVQEALE